MGNRIRKWLEKRWGLDRLVESNDFLFHENIRLFKESKVLVASLRQARTQMDRASWAAECLNEDLEDERKLSADMGRMDKLSLMRTNERFRKDNRMLSIENKKLRHKLALIELENE